MFSFFHIENVNNPVVLTRKGVTVSLNSDGPPQGMDLNQQAGMLMKTGLTEEEALALVTINPAGQIGVDRRVGSLEVGKDADLVVWTGYPLGFFAIADKVFIDGQLYFSREYDSARQAWLEAERVRLEGGAPRQTARPPAATPEPARAVNQAVARTPAAIRSAGARSESLPHSASGTYLIAHARVVTVSGPVLPDASVLIERGKIAAVGATVATPATAAVIDGRGLTVYPGLFDPNSSIGMAAAHPETSFGPLAPHLDASTSFIFDGEDIPLARAAGITHVLARPRGGMVPGQGALMHLAGWTGEQMLGKRRAALLLTFPTVGEVQYTEDDRFIVTPWSATKAQYERRVSELKALFASARAYVSEKAKHATEPGWRPREELEAMIPALERRQVVIVEAANEVDIRAAVQFARAENLDYVLATPTEAWREADFLKANGVRVLVGSTAAYPDDDDAPYDIEQRTPAILHEKGVPFAFATMGRYMPRLFVQSAANAAAHGLPADVALSAMTLTPAGFFGLSDRLGSVDNGKIANLLVTSGDLFDAQATVRYLFVNGEPVGLRTIEDELFEKYIKRQALPAAPKTQAIGR